MKTPGQLALIASLADNTLNHHKCKRRQCKNNPFPVWERQMRWTLWKPSSTTLMVAAYVVAVVVVFGGIVWASFQT